MGELTLLFMLLGLGSFVLTVLVKQAPRTMAVLTIILSLSFILSVLTDDAVQGWDVSLLLVPGVFVTGMSALVLAEGKGAARW